MDNLWVDTLALIERDGHQLGSRDGQSSEILGFTAKLDTANHTFLFNKVRKLSPYYACAEFLWYLSMTDDTSFLQLFAPSYKKFTEDGVHAFGAYGHRWKTNDPNSSTDQITQVIEILRKHPESRQAVITMWEANDLYHAIAISKKDLPCTLTHQFLLRNGYLHLVTNMRSNDAWLGLPYDVFCNTQLQKLVADILGVSVGSYTHNVGSMHYYERNFESIDKILSSKRENVDPPQSLHRAGTSSLDFKDQIKVAIEFIRTYCCESTLNQSIAIRFIDQISTFHSTIGDATFVCCCKVHKDLVNFVYDPQLRRALDVQE